MKVFWKIATGLFTGVFWGSIALALIALTAALISPETAPYFTIFYYCLIISGGTLILAWLIEILGHYIKKRF